MYLSQVHCDMCTVTCALCHTHCVTRTVSPHALCHHTHCVTTRTVSPHALCHHTHCVTTRTVSPHTLCHHTHCVTCTVSHALCHTHCVTRTVTTTITMLICSGVLWVTLFYKCLYMIISAVHDLVPSRIQDDYQSSI